MLMVLHHLNASIFLISFMGSSIFLHLTGKLTIHETTFPTPVPVHPVGDADKHRLCPGTATYG